MGGPGSKGRLQPQSLGRLFLPGGPSERTVYANAEMADLGEKGLAHLHEVIRTEKALTARVYAAEIVGSRGHAKAYADVETF